MNRFVSVFLVLLLACLTIVSSNDATAQSVKVKTYPTTPGKDKGLPTYNGLRVVGEQTKVFLVPDTSGSGSNVVTSVTWQLVPPLPSGSTAAMDSASTWRTSFTPDKVGAFYVQVTVNGTVSAKDTIYAADYVGVGGGWGGYNSQFGQCGDGSCHNAGWFTGDKFNPWSGTGHAKVFREGVTGMLEATNGIGVYATSCPRCHTTGYNAAAANGNFGYLAKTSGWDTSWYAGFTYAGGDYEIPMGDTSIWTTMATSPQYMAQVPVANIGCESCHGPGSTHNGNTKRIGVSLDAELCNTCHDAPTHHMVGAQWRSSDHAMMSKGHASSTSCYPCHSGSAFVKWVGNKSNPGWSVAEDGMFPISCASCHDPHDATNPHQLRTISFDSLMNGYVAAPGDGGKGQICMNCHHSRYSVKKRVTNTAPYFGFVDHYGPHGNPQADMFYGQNGFQYGDVNLTSLRSHAGVPDGCVTCHMESDNAALNSPNGHSWVMVDASGNDRVAACETCHGPLTSFEDIKGAYDYDGNGIIEGVQTEVEGLLAKLRLKLQPYWNSSTQEPTDSISDSLLIKGNQRAVQDIWTYFFVKNDGSMGVHNAKYAISLLQKALNLYPLDVRKTDLSIPKEFVLNQNYPNPFNPTTTISFSLPKSEVVKLEVYDVLGKLVKIIADNAMSAGNYAMTWDGQDANGSKVASGMYIYRLQAGSFNSVKKMLMLK